MFEHVLTLLQRYCFSVAASMFLYSRLLELHRVWFRGTIELQQRKSGGTYQLMLCSCVGEWPRTPMRKARIGANKWLIKP